MNTEQQVPPENNPTDRADRGWQEVGQQFQALGQSLAQAMRTAWENEETQRRVQEMRSGVEAMAQEVGRAVEDTAHSPEGQKIRQGAEHTAESIRSATAQTLQDVQPQLLDALQQLNRELQKLISRLETKGQPAQPSGEHSEPPAP